MTPKMTTSDVARLARELLNAHGYGHIPFELSRAKRRLGGAHFRGKSPLKLTLSRYLTPYLDEYAVRDVILHEIAHFEAGYDAGHGPAWKAAARRLGADPTRTAHVPPELLRMTANYEAKCLKCGTPDYAVRRPKGRYAHAGCGGLMSRYAPID